MSASDLWQSKRNNYVVVCYVQMLMITDYSHTESVDKLIKKNKTKHNTCDAHLVFNGDLCS